VTHTYADGNATYTISATATDEDGTFAAQNTLAVSVNNVTPVLTAVGNQTVSEGTPLTIVNLGQISDPGFKDVLLGTDETFRFSINWGDSSTPSTGNATVDHVGGPLDPTLASFDCQHTYADDGAYTVTVRVADDDMAAYSNAALFATGVAGVDFVEKTFVVHVDNVAPTVVTPNGNQT